jgi:predicted phosphodiesterase
MRIAFISDIHARLQRLDAVLRDIDRVGVDQIICLGDVATMGPDPTEVIHRLRDLACPCIMGNHDEFLIRPGLAREAYGRFPAVCENVERCCEAIGVDDIEYLRSFLPSLTVQLPGGADLLAFHGTPDSNMRMILATTPDSELDGVFDAHDATVMIGGHTHEQMLRRHRDKLIVNAGSVGMPWALPFEGWEHGVPGIAPWAEYAIIRAGEGPDGAAVGVDLRRVALP